MDDVLIDIKPEVLAIYLFLAMYLARAKQVQSQKHQL